MNYTLSVSSDNDLDCKKMAYYLSKSGIITSITENISTCPNIEYGCRLTNTVSDKDELEKLWQILKSKYNFKCGHLHLDGIFSGCILDYLRPSLCSENNYKRPPAPAKPSIVP